jgi:hypothetical protein
MYCKVWPLKLAVGHQEIKVGCQLAVNEKKANSEACYVTNTDNKM